MAIGGIEQGRASYAYSCAKKGSRLERCKEYKSYVRKIPTLVRTNGLGATLAFVASKKRENPSEKGYAYKVIYDQIRQWLVTQGFLRDDQELEEAIIGLNSPEYRLITREVLSLFKWLARFAEALIEGESDD